MPTKKTILQALFIVYVVGAISGGWALGQAIPAMNLLGMAYAGATWPLSMACTVTSTTCFHIEYMPLSVMENFFTFD